MAGYSLAGLSSRALPGTGWVNDRPAPINFFILCSENLSPTMDEKIYKENTGCM
jgi:hypothetical protein